MSFIYASIAAMKKIIKIISSLTLIIILGFGIYVYWQHGQLHPATDDAYTQAHAINIAPRISGQVSQIQVDNNQFVKKGDTLFHIDRTPFDIAVRKAQANLDQTEQNVIALQKQVTSAKAVLAERNAELLIAQQNYRRIMILVKKHSSSLSDGDTFTSKLKVAEAANNAAKANLQQAEANLGKSGANNAQVQQAKTALTQAKLNLSYTTVKSPSSGYVSNFSLRVGDQINAQQSYFSLIENNDWWAQANFKETDLERIRPGQTASIKVDMYPGHIFKGTVTSLSHGSGSSFSLLPAENASGNWVKVTQRFPVRIHINNNSKDYPLRMGASCTVVVDTTNKAT